MVIVWILISLVVIGFIISLIFFLSHTIKKKYRCFVLEHSYAVKKLDTINFRYHFQAIRPSDLFFNYDNEKIFETISCEDYLLYYLRANEIQIKNLMFLADRNRANYSNYLFEYENEVPSFGEYDCSTKGFKLDRLNQFEKQLLSEKKLQPTTSLVIDIYLNLTDLHETRIFRRKTEQFSQNEIQAYLNRLDDKQGDYYRDENVWNSLCRVERGKVTNKMRFYIYQRDGNRCVHCGSRNNLEVNHIIPISKGGKSVPNNLQTLCHRCNIEKGTRTHF